MALPQWQSDQAMPPQRTHPSWLPMCFPRLQGTTPLSHELQPSSLNNFSMALPHTHHIATNDVEFTTGYQYGEILEILQLQHQHSIVSNPPTPSSIVNQTQNSRLFNFNNNQLKSIPKTQILNTHNTKIENLTPKIQSLDFPITNNKHTTQTNPKKPPKQPWLWYQLKGLRMC